MSWTSVKPYIEALVGIVSVAALTISILTWHTDRKRYAKFQAGSALDKVAEAEEILKGREGSFEVTEKSAEDLARADTLLCQALRSDPDCVDAKSIQAVIVAQRGQIGLALTEMDSLMRENTTSARVHRAYANILELHGDDERAMKELSSARDLDASDSKAVYNIAYLEHKRGDVGSATRDYRAAIELDHYFPQPYINLVDLYRSQKRFTETDGLCKEAIEARHLAQLHLLLNCGEALRDAGRLDEAYLMGVGAIQRYPERPDGFGFVAEVLRRQGRLEEAASKCRHARELNPMEATLSALDSSIATELASRRVGQHKRTGRSQHQGGKRS